MSYRRSPSLGRWWVAAGGWSFSVGRWRVVLYWWIQQYPRTWQGQYPWSNGTTDDQCGQGKMMESKLGVLSACNDTHKALLLNIRCRTYCGNCIYKLFSYFSVLKKKVMLRDSFFLCKESIILKELLPQSSFPFYCRLEWCVSWIHAPLF